ncbi:hypothetical protein RSK20926_04857 [Roseobacter sp. SK209-2-6]|uniref:protein-tyrosine phosphatase family protein n=1 Tax=Roseobacter sp. SK209-2-6 TaxID=388739 RepID=UPI0000F3CD58|nr:protein-tyrosine phosphatase family protein [Roseobacter sp. SK209-2-6]EBA15913.1 hypothetical protein RSK20926_04857 [Roseobacter sp. SK209-2-6]
MQDVSSEANLEAPNGLTLYALSVGEGILALCPLPGAGGDLLGDLNHIHEWEPGLVISMTTDAEHAAVGAADLGLRLQNMGCRWSHLPLADFSAPDHEMCEPWQEVSALALQALRGGGRVLVHCKGGCGRSGMVLLRLMVESGEPPAKALARLRAVRPCAVETQSQMEWAYAGAHAAQS